MLHGSRLSGLQVLWVVLAVLWVCLLAFELVSGPSTLALLSAALCLFSAAVNLVAQSSGRLELSADQAVIRHLRRTRTYRRADVASVRRGGWPDRVQLVGRDGTPAPLPSLGLPLDEVERAVRAWVDEGRAIPADGEGPADA